MSVMTQLVGYHCLGSFRSNNTQLQHAACFVKLEVSYHYVTGAGQGGHQMTGRTLNLQLGDALGVRMGCLKHMVVMV